MNCPLLDQMRSSCVALITPVIHVQTVEQALRNLEIVANSGCPGAFVINHDFPMDPFVPMLQEIRRARPDLWLGVNFLAQPGHIAFPVLGELARDGCVIDAYWADDARIDERAPAQGEAEQMAQLRQSSGWKGSYFGGVAFKKQRPVDPDMFATSAALARPYMDVVTTSGVATGHAADTAKIATFRKALGAVPMALASGVTPDNAGLYARLVDCILVATGINAPGDFYNIDPDRLTALQTVIAAEVPNRD